MLTIYNFAIGTVSAGYNASATSIDLTAGHGARFPSSGPFRCVWWNQTDYPNPADDPNREIVEVTARSTDTLTITRGMETSYGGVAASTKNTGGKTYAFALVNTAGTILSWRKSASLISWLALENQPPASNFATPDTRNSWAVLDFDDTTDESAVFVGIMPEGADLSSGISVFLHVAFTSATSGAAIFEGSFERGATDVDSDSFGTVKFASGSANATSGIIVKIQIDFDAGEIDGITAGDIFRLKISRDANGTNGTDDASGDAELFAVEIQGRT